MFAHETEPESERIPLENNLRIRRRMDAAFSLIDPGHLDVDDDGVIGVSTWWGLDTDGHIAYELTGPLVTPATRPLFEAALVEAIRSEYPRGL